LSKRGRLQQDSARKRRKTSFGSANSKQIVLSNAHAHTWLDLISILYFKYACRVLNVSFLFFIVSVVEFLLVFEFYAQTNKSINIIWHLSYVRRSSTCTKSGTLFCSTSLFAIQFLSVKFVFFFFFIICLSK
jgi:hypothetical protein